MTSAARTHTAAPISPEEAAYRERTPTSEKYFLEARAYLPGGDSRSTLFYRPYPAVFARGEGARVFDVDENELLDFTGNHSALVHGYGHPYVTAAARRQLELGTAFSGPTEPQLTLARQLCERVDSLERVRFTNSGTEATLNTIRAARAFTGRQIIAVAEGSYHGSLGDAAPGMRPEVIQLPFDDGDGATTQIREHGHELAAVLIEPVQGAAGMIPADGEYLRQLRAVTQELGILLVFDEVISFRVAFGGAQQHFGIRPDLTIFGKLIGGGFPLGAFGGRADIMALFDPSRGPPTLPHPGSFNANPMSLAAGAAALELLTREVIDRLNDLGEFVRARLRLAFRSTGIPVQITGLGSLFGIHPGACPIRCRRDADTADAALRHRLFLGLYNEGMLLDPRGVGTLSTALTDADVDRFIDSLRTVLSRLGV